MSKSRFLLGILILCLLTWLPVSAGDPGAPDQALSKKESKKRFAQVEQFLKEATLARDRKDVEGMKRALQKYVHNMSHLERAIDGWRGPQGERREVSEIITRAISRHADLLLELSNRVEGETGVDWTLEEAIMQLVFFKLAWQETSP